MGTWIELRCENREEPSSKGTAKAVGIGTRCWSHDNVGPMEMAADTMVSIRATVASVAEDARRSGWEKTREGWVCPFCVKARKNTDAAQAAE